LIEIASVFDTYIHFLTFTLTTGEIIENHQQLRREVAGADHHSSQKGRNIDPWKQQLS